MELDSGREASIGQLPWEWVDRGDAGRHAVVDGLTALSYAELAYRVDAVADAFLTAGLRQGDSMLIQLPNCWEFIVTTLACQRIGVATVFALMPHRIHELTGIIRRMPVHAVAVVDRWGDFDHRALVDQAFGPQASTLVVAVVGESVAATDIDIRACAANTVDRPARRIRLDSADIAPWSVATVLLTSGSTGESKLVPHTHIEHIHAFRSCGDVCGLTVDTRYLAVLPVAHNFSLASPGILGVLDAGGTVILARSPNPQHALPLLERESATMTAIVPAIAQRWLACIDDPAMPALDLSTLSLVQIGGAITPPRLAAQLAERLSVAVQQVYGMSEGLICLTRPDDPYEIAHHTQGRPASPFDEVRVIDAAGNDARVGEVGELVTKGRSLFEGYVGQPLSRVSGDRDDGWHRTGDLVRLHSSGNIVVVGRIKESINRGGEKISPTEVEAAARDMPGVGDVVAFAWPDDELGEIVGAAIIVEKGHTEPTIADLERHFARFGLAHYKVPGVVFYVDEFAVTSVGKVDRLRTRDGLLSRSDARC
ncbi:AMP-binding protein [Nocardia sp. CC201C]|uniref:AMP-binding protein n=1 Tax=Nocardia sp. CC201C TaxID=3044575 RepID=UPI0024A9DD6D|nr:AMP-binding protein [Nocardia sp. CC201C]